MIFFNFRLIPWSAYDPFQSFFNIIIKEKIPNIPMNERSLHIKPNQNIIHIQTFNYLMLTINHRPHRTKRGYQDQNHHYN